MHAVIVDGDVSYPATSGKRLRTLHLMLRLARRHRLTYIGRCDVSRPEARQAREFLTGHGIETILVNHPVPHKTGLAFYGRLACYERTHFPRATEAVAVSTADARILRDDFGVARVSVVDNGIDRAFFETVDGSARQAQRILFLGALDWRPNLDAVGLLLDEVF